MTSNNRWWRNFYNPVRQNDGQWESLMQPLCLNLQITIWFSSTKEHCDDYKFCVPGRREIWCCNSLHSGLSHRDISRLQLTENSAAGHDHITHIPATLHWLSGKYRTNFKLLLITFKALHGPAYIRDLFAPSELSCCLRSPGMTPFYCSLSTPCFKRPLDDTNQSSQLLTEVDEIRN